MLDQIILGLHLATVHVPDRPWLSSATPGIYARAPEGWSAGVFRNSFGRASVYGGFQFEPVAHLSIGVGLVSGYEYRMVEQPCGKFYPGLESWGACWIRLGSTEHAIAPIIVPSVYYGPVRLSYIPSFGRDRASDALSLSIEFPIKLLTP